MQQPHAESVTPPRGTLPARTASPRVLGIDLARGIALFGMMATHILPRIDEAGHLTVAGLFQGRASALFAILAGFSIILATRSTLARPGVRGWATASLGLVVRGLLIALIGLALGELPSGIAVILVNYGALFLLAPVFLRFPTWALGTTAALWFLIVPQVSHALRGLPALEIHDLLVPAFSVMGDPDMWVGLLTSGYYPVLQWTGYIVLGMWLARVDWTDASRRVSLLLGGAGVATLALSASTLLLNTRARWELESLTGEQHLQGLTSVDEVLLLGSYGVTPPDSAWWLTTAAPHSGTTFDLLQTAGCAAATIALCLLVGPALARGPVALHAWLSRTGSMPLTLYSLHIVVLGAAEVLPPMPAFDAFDWAAQWFLANCALLIAVALLWTSLVSRRGPLESLLSAAVCAVQQAILPPAPAVGDVPASAPLATGVSGGLPLLRPFV